MIVVAIGSNLPFPSVGGPRSVCKSALADIAAAGVAVVRRSSWYRTAPVPASDQPDFINGVAAVETGLSPPAFLALLHEIEDRYGRARSVANAARTLDLDLIAWNDVVREGPEPPILPHPRMAQRAFVLQPLAEIAPGWRHPVSGETVEALIEALPAGQRCERLDPATPV